MDWGRAYEEHQRDIRDQLVRARQARSSFLRLASKTVSPVRLTDRQISDIALRDAEVIVQTAINQHNEKVK